MGTHSTTSKQTVWNVALVQDFTSMFEEARSFNKAISTWPFSTAGDVVIANGFNSMFKNAAVFNNGIFKVDTVTAANGQIQVTELQNMFEGAAAFNQDITAWVPTKVTTFNSMFKNAAGFNRDIVTWKDKIANAKFFTSMFEGAVEFNQNLNNWQLVTAQVDDASGLQSMFSGASKFQQNLCGWQTDLAEADQPTPTNDMFLNTRCPPANANVDLDDITGTVADDLLLGTVCCTCLPTPTDDATLYPACAGAALQPSR